MDENQLALWMEKIKQAQMQQPLSPEAGVMAAMQTMPQEQPQEQNWLRQFVNGDKMHNPTPGRRIPLSTVGVRG